MSLELRLDGADHELLRGILDLPAQSACGRARASARADAVDDPSQEGEHQPGQDTSEQEQRRNGDPAELGRREHVVDAEIAEDAEDEEPDRPDQTASARRR